MKYYSTNTATPVQSIGSDHNIIDLIDKVCDVMGVHKSHLQTKSREIRIKYARWMVWYLLRERGYTLREAGKCFNGLSFDHSTVLNAVTKLPDDANNIHIVKKPFKILCQWNASIQFVDY